MKIKILSIFPTLVAVLLSGCANNHAAPAQVGFELKQNHIATTQAIHYVGNSAQIGSESNPVLDAVVQFLENNPTVHIEISDTTNNIDGTGFNFPLSQERAESAKAYIVAFGVDPNRVQALALEQVVVFPH